MAELLKLQQKQELPPEVTAEDLTDLLVEQVSRSGGARLWRQELNIYEDTDIYHLLALVWQVNVGMKMRDVEFEARRRLTSRVSQRPSFQDAETSRTAQDIARSLMEMPPEAFGCKCFGPQEVVMEVVLKVVQDFWPHPTGLSHSIMASLHLSDTAVSIAKEVLDWLSPTLSTVDHRATFSCTDRDHMVLSILEKVRQMYSKDVLEEELNSFSPEVLTTIMEVTVQEIRRLFRK
ncbi:uncharacterized protein LOC117503234 [Thalassophryne amazonica]|uniref:uncharacterized protein LOC117503234 n=1 Tax=Thalassophryne amazonica TaxID=390379 RepID=UPI0014710EE9|nr:uncharacterized protein LOC117503234 [Thalassophryne amazonica]